MLQLRFYTLKDDDHDHAKLAENAFTTLNESYFNSKLFSDFTLISADEQKYPVHRCIIAARSEVLKKMLSSSMSESKTKQAVMEDIKGNTLIEMLRFIYTGTVENLESIASNLLYAAEKYDLTELKLRCADELIKTLSSENVFKSLVLADQCNAERLKQKCFEFIKMLVKLNSNIYFYAFIKVSYIFFKTETMKN